MAGTTLDIDGIDFKDGYALEAKLVKVPPGKPSPYRGNLSAPPPVIASMEGDIASEFDRYSRLFKDPATPLKGLKIITNDAEAQAYLERRMREFGIPGFVILAPE